MADIPLTGYRALDLTSLYMGPFCTRMLADYGADVIKIEPISGDPARDEGPFFHDENHPEKSGLFLHLNVNKRSMTTNIETAQGQKIIRELAKSSDIVVESFKPGYLDNLGLGYEDLVKINPKIIVTSVTNFGQTGPYKNWEGTDLTLYAMGASMKTSGQEHKYPLKIAGRIASFQTGNLAATATALAIWNRELTGASEHVDVSFFETWKGAIDRSTNDLVAYSYTKESSKRQWNPGMGIANGVFRCKDGYFHISAAGAIRFPRLMRMIGKEKDLIHPPWNNPNALNRPETLELFDSFFIPWMLEHTKTDLRNMCQEQGVLGAPINTIEDLLNDPHYIQRGYWQEIEHPETGTVKYPGFPFKLHATPNPERVRAPLLGEHTNEILRNELNYSDNDIQALQEQGVI